MLFFRRRVLLYAFKIFDVLVMILSFALASAVRMDPNQVSWFSPGRILAIHIRLESILLFFSFLFLWHIVFHLFGLYRSMRFSSRWIEIFGVLKAGSTGVLVMIGVAFLLKIKMITPVFAIVFWVTSIALSLLGRIIMRSVMARRRIRGRNLRFMLILGTNKRAIKFAKETDSRKELGYRIIGFVDNHWSEIEAVQREKYSVVTDFDGLASFLRDNVVDELVICLPFKSYYDQIAMVIQVCEEQGIVVRILSDIFDLKYGRLRTQHHGSDSMWVYTGRMEGLPVLAKRLLDIFGALVLLVALSPLFLVAAVLVKAASPGPIFFVQKRVGFNKRIFNLYKFRTMVSDAEKRLEEMEHLNEVSGPVFKIKRDPRVTWSGRFLRRTSIDELPQLFNVLKGDMGLVGPRPLPVRDYNGFDQDWHRRRFSIRPGITCLWQANGRSNISFEKWMELDMEYIDRWSLWLDIKILARTALAVLRMSGAS